MEWDDFVNLICDTERERPPNDWRGLHDASEEADVVLYTTLRRRPADPFRFLKSWYGGN